MRHLPIPIIVLIEMNKLNLYIPWLPLIVFAIISAVQPLLKVYDIYSVCTVINPPNGREYLCGDGYASIYISSFLWVSVAVFAVALIRTLVLKIKISLPSKVGYILSSAFLLVIFASSVYFWLQNLDYP